MFSSASVTIPSQRLTLHPISSSPMLQRAHHVLMLLYIDLDVGLDGSLKRLWVGTDHLTNLLAVLEQEESRHGADTELLGDVWDLIDVELVEARIGVGVGHPVGDVVSIRCAIIWGYFDGVGEFWALAREKVGLSCNRFSEIVVNDRKTYLTT